MEREGSVREAEDRLGRLFAQALAGDAAAYRIFLGELGAHLRGFLRRRLERLPDRQRLPIVHMKLEGLSAAQTARRTGMSESAVKVGVHRGLKALAVLIREER